MKFHRVPSEISQFQNMASIKTNKIKKRTPLLYINVWKLTTLLFCPKRFIHSKGPKMVFDWTYDKRHCIFNLQCSLLWLSQRQIAFLGPLKWMNLFGQKSKVVSFQKLILFVLMDAIFWNCDISVGTQWNFKIFCFLYYL